MSRRQYPFHLIEPKWQQRWEAEQTFRAWNPGDSVPASHPFGVRHQLAGKTPAAAELPPKFYILDMFPYPSGAGLHVGHPEGYTATDILARYRRSRGFNVLHPMGWDSFGLPAEQYAVKTGQHPRKTTETNIANFTRQIRSLGFSYDWTRELATTDQDYFKWTQWIFLQLYNSWFNPATNKAEPIETLAYPADCTTEDKKRAYRDSKRLAYVSEAPVNWCPELGTVLANEEVIDGKSEVGGFPVIRKPMKQWMLRITAFAEKLLADLDTIEWSDSLKEMQRNWIGRSEGALVEFRVQGSESKVTVFTTRPDTLFGATYMVLSPEHALLKEIVTPDQAAAVKQYQEFAAGKSDLERTELSKEKTGVWTGACALNPVNGEQIPIWIADYVLASYGTGAIMAVPAHDERDFEFAKKFELKIKAVVGTRMPKKSQSFQPSRGYIDIREQVLWFEIEGANTPVHFSDLVCDADEGFAVNSQNSEISLNGLPTPEAKAKITAWLESKGLGKKTVNFKLRDWLFSRQRYWGEPFPIVWKRDEEGVLYHEALPESALPLLPPVLDDYKPTADGQPPLARAKDWLTLPDGAIRETNTMPQWAGSCWYYLRYADNQNAAAFVSPEAEGYWMGSSAASPAPKSQTPSPKSTPGVDLYVGGTEHAVLHLLYARFWHKVLFDLGHVSTAEPFYKLVNQGLILGEDGQKMSKSRGNVVNPDDVLKEFGADAFRLYEMFMGPLQDVKPWNTRGVEGVYRFLGRVWRLFVDEKAETEYEQAETVATGTEPANALLGIIQLSAAIQDAPATPAQLKALHACIKKVTEDLDALRFNTAISTMMIFVNEAMTWTVKPWAVMRDFLQLLAPFAPHLAEELWDKLHATRAGAGTPSLSYAVWPIFDPALLVEQTVEISFQREGKPKEVIRVPTECAQNELEEIAFANETIQPYLEDRVIQRTISKPGKFVNVVTMEVAAFAEQKVKDYLERKWGGELKNPPAPNAGYDLYSPARNTYVEVKSTGFNIDQLKVVSLSTNQYAKIQDALNNNSSYELHLLSGIQPATGTASGHYSISGQYIVDNAKQTKNGWMVPVSGGFDSFKL